MLSTTTLRYPSWATDPTTADRYKDNSPFAYIEFISPSAVIWFSLLVLARMQFQGKMEENGGKCNGMNSLLPHPTFILSPVRVV